MRIKSGFELRTVCHEYVVVAFGEENIDFSKVISLNQSAALMWQAVAGKDFTASDMADALLCEYDVDQQTALRDAEEMLTQWQAAGLVE